MLNDLLKASKGIERGTVFSKEVHVGTDIGCFALCAVVFPALQRWVHSEETPSATVSKLNIRNLKQTMGAITSIAVDYFESCSGLKLPSASVLKMAVQNKPGKNAYSLIPVLSSTTTFRTDRRPSQALAPLVSGTFLRPWADRLMAICGKWRRCTFGGPCTDIVREPIGI